MDIFCVKCRKKVQPVEVSAGVVTFTRKKTGAQGTRYSLQATCPNCGINMKRFIKQEDLSKYPNNQTPVASTSQEPTEPVNQV